MKLKMFSLFDKKSGSYAQPFFFNHHGQAIRAVMDLLQDGNTLPARHPADFELWELGCWDDQDGSFYGSPEHHGSLVQFLPTPQPNLKLAGE